VPDGCLREHLVSGARDDRRAKRVVTRVAIVSRVLIVVILQVVEAGEGTMRLRVVATAAESGNAWDLRCEIRERLIAHLQEHYPWAPPRLRTTVEGGPAAVNS
jgi:hypothetical protein